MRAITANSFAIVEGSPANGALSFETFFILDHLVDAAVRRLVMKSYTEREAQATAGRLHALIDSVIDDYLEDMRDCENEKPNN